MISEVLSAIDELYIQEASCELNSCLEILNEYDKLYKTQGIVSINTYDMNKFFQENAWSDEVKRMNRGKSTINKIIFTIPRMIVALVKLITGQLKKHKPVTQQQAQRIEQQIQHVNPKNIHVSKKGSMLDIAAVVGGSAALAGVGAIAYIGFKKAMSPKAKLDKQDLDKTRMMLVLEQKKTAQLEKEKEESDELAEINKNYATEKEEEADSANKALTKANDEIKRLQELNKDVQKENQNLANEKEKVDNENTLLRAEVNKRVSPEECNKRLSGLYIEFIKLLSDMVSVVKENPNKERIDGIKKQIQEMTKEFNIDTRGNDETVVVPFEELCKYVNENAKKVEDLSGKLGTLKTKFDSLQEEHDEHMSANVKLAKQNEELQKKLEGRKKENKKKLKENVDAAIKFIPNTGKFKKLNDELKALEKKIEEGNEKYSGLLGEINEAESKKNKLNEEVKAAQQSHDAEMDKLKNTFNEEKSNHDAEMNKLKNEQAEANKILSSIKDKIKELEDTKKDLDNKIKTATNIDNLNEKAEQLNSELQNKKAEIAGKDKEISKLEKELKETVEELNALKTAHSMFDKSFSNYAYLDKQISDEYFKQQTKIKQTDEKTASTAENEYNEELLAACADAMRICTQSLTGDVKHISDAQELISEASEIAVTSEKPEESEESEQQQEKPEENDEKPEENDEKSEESENSETEDVDDSSKESEESEETNDNPEEPEESDVEPSEQQQEKPEESEKHEEKPETTEDVAMKHAIEKAIEDKHTQPISLKQAQQDMRSALQGNGTAGFMTDDPDRPGKLKKVDNFNEAKYIVLNDYFLYPKQFGNIKDADLDPKIFNIDFKDITNNNTTIEPALISSMSIGDIILKGNIYNTNPDQYNAIRDERNKPKETQSLDTSINNDETNENKKPFDYDKELDELEKFNPNKDQQLTDNNDDIQNTSDNRDDNDKTTEETSGEQKTFVFDDYAIYGNKSDDNGYRIYNEISDIGDDTLRQLIADGVDTLYKCFIKNESKYEFVSIFGNSNFLKEHFKDKYIKNFLTTTYTGTSKEFMDKLKELNITVAKFKKFEDNTNIDELRKKYPNLIVVNSEYTFPRKKTIGERVNDSFGKWFKSGNKNDLRDADDTTNSTNEKMQQYIDKSNEVMNQVDDVTAKAMNLKQ